MKKMLMMMVLLAAGAVSVTAFAQETKAATQSAKSSLASARSKIDQVVEKPDLMKDVMEMLSAEDQIAFVADVVRAISDLPASDAEKTAKFIDVSRAALAGAAEGTAPRVTAEIFATVPPEALTMVSEALAAETYNRQNYTVAAYTKVAKEVMGEVNERCESTDNGSPRVALAIVMFSTGLNGTEAEQATLTATLIDTMKHDDAKAAAKEWIVAAQGKDGEKSYEAILAAADAGKRPDTAAVLPLTNGIQFHDSVMADLTGKYTDAVEGLTNSKTPVLDAIENKLTIQQGVIGATQPGAAGQAGGEAPAATQETEKSPETRPNGETEHEEEGPEVRPYPGQRY